MLKRNPKKTFQKLLPNIMHVIGQCIESTNETGARQLFDVLETLLVLVSDLDPVSVVPE